MSDQSQRLALLRRIIAQDAETIYRQEQELAALKEAVWDAYRILGFDTDGADWRCMTHPTWPEFVRQFATEMAKDYDQVLEEIDGWK